MATTAAATSWPRWWLALIVVLHVLPFATRPGFIGGDEPHYALMAHSIANDFDLDLDPDYRAVAEGSNAAGYRIAGKTLEHHVIDIRGRSVFSHPLGLPLLVAPLIALQSLVAPAAPPDWILALTTLLLTLIALLCLARLATQYCGDSRARFLAFALYFSTPLWYYSRTFFTEPYIWLFAILGVTSLASRRSLVAGLFFALALAMKETALLIVAPLLGATLLLLGLRHAARASVGPAIFGAAFVAKNLALTGEPFVTFQPYEIGHPIAGAIGLLFDPAHGLTWFAPLCVIAIAGWLIPADTKTDRVLRMASLVIAAGYFAVAASWIDWRGGSCYGPRLIVPSLIAFTYPLLRLYASRNRIVHAALAAGFVAGFAVNFTAACDPFFAFWGASAFGLLEKNIVPAAGGVLLGTALLIVFTRCEARRSI